MPHDEMRCMGGGSWEIEALEITFAIFPETSGCSRQAAKACSD
jgi:hypothetical protein